MEKAPNGFIVYWTSQFSGNHPGWSTPKFKANMKTVKSEEAAVKLVDDLNRAKQLGTTYQSRLVYHVGGFHKVEN